MALRRLVISAEDPVCRKLLVQYSGEEFLKGEGGGQGRGGGGSRGGGGDKPEGEQE